MGVQHGSECTDSARDAVWIREGVEGAVEVRENVQGAEHAGGTCRGGVAWAGKGVQGVPSSLFGPSFPFLSSSQVGRGREQEIAKLAWKVENENHVTSNSRQ